MTTSCLLSTQGLATDGRAPCQPSMEKRTTEGKSVFATKRNIELDRGKTNKTLLSDKQCDKFTYVNNLDVVKAAKTYD